MSIRKKLPLLIAILVSVPLILTSIISYVYTSKTLNSESENKILLLSQISSAGITGLLNSEKKEVELFAKRKEIIELSKVRLLNGNLDALLSSQENAVNGILKERIGKLDNHEHIFLADKNGIIIADSNESTMKADINDRDYFKEAVKGKLTISNTLFSKVNGKAIIVFAAPVVDESGSVIGVMGNAVYTDYFVKGIKDIKLGKTGYVYIVDSNGIMLFHPTEDKVGKVVENEKMKNIVERAKGGEDIKNSVEDYSFNGDKKIMGYCMIPEVKWVFALTQDYKDIYSTAKNVMNISIITVLLAILIAAGFGIVFSNGITKPIGELMVIMDKASKGDITVQSDIESKDELGNLSTSFNIMIENISSVIRLVKGQSEKIDSHSQNLSAVSEEMSASSDEVSKAVQDVAVSSGDQAQNLSSITEVVNEFGRGIESIVKAIGEIDTNAKDVSSLALKSNSNMGPLVQSVDKINSSFREFTQGILSLGKDINKINEITEVLNNIADQTNLLSLNASIEAARAGEAGRGFSVVAEEIRKLAEQSKKSSENISKLIGGISGQANVMVESTEAMNVEFTNQVDIINIAVSSFRDIINSIEKVVPMIEAVSASATNIDNEKDTILEKVESVAAFAEEVSASSEEIVASSEEMSASSTEVASSAQELSQMTRDMMEEVNKFTI